MSPLATNSGYSNVFLMLGLFAIGASVVLFALIPKLRTLMQEKNSESCPEVDMAITE